VTFAAAAAINTTTSTTKAAGTFREFNLLQVF
jgi:hypothetical protein